MQPSVGIDLTKVQDAVGRFNDILDVPMHS